MSETLRITRPCDRQWRDLVGDDARRFCGDCQKWVHNLDVLSRSEIAALRRAGGLCGMYVGDEAGLFRVPLSHGSARAAASVAAVVLASVVAGCSSDAPPPRAPAASERPAVSSQTQAECEKKAPANDRFAQLPPEEQEKIRERLRRLGYVE